MSYVTEFLFSFGKWINIKWDPLTFHYLSCLSYLYYLYIPPHVCTCTASQGPPHNGPSYATWERTLRGQAALAAAQGGPPVLGSGGPSLAPPSLGQARVSSVSSSLSNLSSVSSAHSPVSGPWYRHNLGSVRGGQVQGQVSLASCPVLLVD